MLPVASFGLVGYTDPCLSIFDPDKGRSAFYRYHLSYHEEIVAGN